MGGGGGSGAVVWRSDGAQADTPALSGRSQPPPARTAALLVTAILLAGFIAPAVSIAGPPPPNILFIEIDDMNDWVEGFGGHTGTRTPNIMELASRGVRFDNAHAPSPLCNPSRTAILTGLAPRRTGVLDNQKTPLRAWIPPFAETIFQFFLSKGYYVAGKGKHFHLETDDQAEPWSELQPFNWYRGQAPSTPYHGLQELLDVVFQSFNWGPTVGATSQWGDYKIASYGIEFLGRSHGAPFFLALGFTLPHLQWQVPQQYWDRFPAQPGLPPYLAGDRGDTPLQAQTKIDTEAHRIITQGGKWNEAVRAYLASISFVDDQVGRLLNALDNSAYADNTIVVLWSDHGFHLGEKDAWQKSTLWEESTRVPFIIVAPGVTPAGGVSTKAVSLLDIYPTLVQLAGFTPRQQVDGVSLVGLLQDPVNGQRSIDYAVTSYYFGNSIRDQRWRYTTYTQGGEELYDHALDPNEHVNLASSPVHSSIKAGLAGRLSQALTFGPSLIPSLAISAPQDWEQLSGKDVVLTATALDPEDGNLSAAIQWSSNVDGPISSPASLSFGPHVITASVTDSSGQLVTRPINLRIRDARDDYVASDAVFPVIINALANDLGFADPVVAQVVVPPAAGSVAVSGSPGNKAGIRFAYSPPAGFTGVARFTYSVDDGLNLDTASVEVLIRSDTDGDGVDDSVDNCLGVPNPYQRDTNADGFGNLCDADLDNNGIVNAADLGMFRSRFGSNDPDADFDGNGFVNFADLARLKSGFGRPPGPSALVP